MDNIIFIKVPSSTSVDEVKELAKDLEDSPTLAKYNFVLLPGRYDIMSADQVKEMMSTMLCTIEGDQ